MSRAWRPESARCFSRDVLYLVETVDEHIGGPLALEDVHQHLVSALVTNRDRFGEWLRQHHAMSESRLSKKLQRSLVCRRNGMLGYSSLYHCYGVQLTLRAATLCSANSRTWQAIAAGRRAIIQCGRFRPSG